jgi:hypothetical protein
MSSNPQLSNYIDNIDDGRININKIKKNITQVNGKEEDSHLRMTQNYYDFMGWIFTMLIILWLIYLSYVNKSYSTTVTLYILFILLIIYILQDYII